MKFIVKRAEVTYVDVLVEVSDDYEGDAELEAKWIARKGGEVIAESERSTIKRLPWCDWSCEKYE